ncbi:AzlD domain-containing protein [Cryptosporangium phraense]|uniref:AzlD domain-containing protein n=1 Tax=Cryptosporangium phraense TaxID=2593070 RepID=A0A545AZC1_9ACTN|nr:AzlD domain-containing protein [Cryptosporangium phraense]TQS46644.1 AzlD domain-containing protein [Cryptosporangium phraense]
MIWLALALAAAGCYLFKLLGLSLPSRWLADPRVLRIAMLLPVALLAALVAVQTFGDGRSLVLDARAAGLGVAVVAVLLRAPFLLVVVLAAATAATVRAVSG